MPGVLHVALLQYLVEESDAIKSLGGVALASPASLVFKDVLGQGTEPAESHLASVLGHGQKISAAHSIWPVRHGPRFYDTPA